MSQKTVKQSPENRLGDFPTQDLPLKAPAEIYWNEHLVPFINAQDDGDCAFLIGMTQAHLRLGQMTFIRRVAMGRLSESAGPFTVKIDEFIRTLQLSHAVPEIEKQLPDETRQWLENFVRGINYYQHNVKKTPPEFGILGLKLEPWTVQDILILGRLMSVDVNWMNWTGWLSLSKKPYWDEVWERMHELGMDSTPSYAPSGSMSDQIFLGGSKSGSNAFAVSGDKTTDGHTILASDPHLGIMVPNIWVIIGFKSPSYHTVGLMFPGVPMVLVGRNEHLAWGGTNMRSASSELYEITDLNLADIDSTQSEIKVRYWFNKKITTRFTKYGAVISDARFFNPGDGREYAMQWIGYAPTDEYTAFLKANRAQSWEEFRNAFESYGVSGQNFVYADDKGNIGLVPAVKIPKRNYKHPDGFVMNPENPNHQWQGYYNTLELPHPFNPEKGFIVSANNKPFDAQLPLGFGFSSNDRTQRMTELLEDKDEVSIDYVKQIQTDVYVKSAFLLKNQLIKRIHELDEGIISEAKVLINDLEEWDGYYNIDSQGAVAFQTVLYFLIQNYYENRFDEDFAKKLLSYDKANWFVLQDMREDTSSNMREQLANTINEAADNYRYNKYWGDLHVLTLRHPLGHIPVVGRKYIYNQMPMPGAYNTLAKTAHQISYKKHDIFYGANARFICQPHDTKNTYFTLLGGQDGWLTSKYLNDQVDLWQNGDYVNIPLDLEEVRKRSKEVMKFR